MHLINNFSSQLVHQFPEEAGYFLVIGYWGCAAGWGHIFTAGLTIMNGIAHFRDLGDQKIQVGRDLKMRRFLLY